MSLRRACCIVVINSMRTLLVLTFAAALAATAQDYKVTGKIDIGGPASGWDYLTSDPGAHRLYVSNGTRVAVVDTEASKVIGEIPDTPGVHGIALAQHLNKGFISCGRANKVVVFDLKTLKATGEVATGKNPDAISYEPVTGRVFTFNGGSKDSTAFDAKTGAVAGTIPMGGKPEFAQVDGKGTIYVNNEDSGEILEVNAKALKVARKWSLAPCESPSGLAIDTKHARLFSVCENKLMAISDIKTGKVLTTLPIGEGADGVAFDPGTGTAFSSNGEGTMTVVQDVKGKYEVVQTVTTKRGARTVTVDTATHRVYTPTAAFGPAPAPTEQNKRPRAPMLADTFHLLVVAK
jgi:DNA-binding beta-propeller fold protein YncE